MTTSDLAGRDVEPPQEPPPSPPPPPPAEEPRSDGGHRDRAADGGQQDAAAEHATLLDDTSSADYRARWERLQIGFVDSPAETVAEADELVAEILQRIAQTFADERGALEQQWSGQGEPSTEDLRVALQRYRAFFARLLSV
jgi:hypothetical protein